MIPSGPVLPPMTRAALDVALRTARSALLADAFSYLQSRCRASDMARPAPEEVRDWRLGLAEPLALVDTHGRIAALVDDAVTALALHRPESGPPRRRALDVVAGPYLELVLAGDRTTALAHVRGLLNAGMSLDGVVEVLEATQLEIGSPWRQGDSRCRASVLAPVAMTI